MAHKGMFFFTSVVLVLGASLHGRLAAAAAAVDGAATGAPPPTRRLLQLIRPTANYTSRLFNRSGSNASSAAGQGLLGPALTELRQNLTGCPPKGYDSVPDFNITAYAAAPWYVQSQVPVSYQSPDELYCVRAKYTLINPNNTKEGVIVRNYANRGRVNGPLMGTSMGNATFDTLEAVPDPTAGSSPTAASKLLVGPQVLRRTLPAGAWQAAYGPYWVVALGPSKNSTIAYDWAVITGGPPRTPSNGACRTGRLGPQSLQYEGGFWLFARKPVDPEAKAAAQAAAAALGLDTSLLLNVTQANCTYRGAD